MVELAFVAAIPNKQTEKGQWFLLALQSFVGHPSPECKEGAKVPSWQGGWLLVLTQPPPSSL